MTHEVSTADHGGVAAVRGARSATTAGSGPSTEQVGRSLQGLFAIIGYVTPAGEPRSSGIVYAAEGRRLYLAVAPDGWKARQIRDDQQVR